MSEITSEDFKIENLEKLEEIGMNLEDFEEIPKDEKPYTILGKGNFGYVEKMKSKKNNKIYAIKKLNIRSGKFKTKEFFRETTIMMNLDHPNIVKLHGYFLDKEKLKKFKEIHPKEKEKKLDKIVYCLVLDCIENGTLDSFYKEHLKKYPKPEEKFVPIEQELIIKIFKQLLDAVKYIHGKNIMHRDIKPDNIFFDAENNIKLSDFGIAALYGDEEENNSSLPNDLLMTNFTTVGRIDFIPEDMVENSENQKYDFKVDIFSLGLTMLCLMSKEKTISVKKINADEINRKIYKNKMDQSYNIYLRKLVIRMISQYKEIRPTAQEAYDELIKIEEIIANPEKLEIKKQLDDINAKYKEDNSDEKNVRSIYINPQTCTSKSSSKNPTPGGPPSKVETPGGKNDTTPTPSNEINSYNQNYNNQNMVNQMNMNPNYNNGYNMINPNYMYINQPPYIYPGQNNSYNNDYNYNDNYNLNDNQQFRRMPSAPIYIPPDNSSFTNNENNNVLSRSTTFDEPSTIPPSFTPPLIITPSSGPPLKESDSPPIIRAPSNAPGPSIIIK